MTTIPFRPLTKSDVAEVLGVSIRTIENLVKSERMPAPGHIGGRALWHPELFYSWLDAELRQPGNENGKFTVEGEALTTLTDRDIVGLGLFQHASVEREAADSDASSELSCSTQSTKPYQTTAPKRTSLSAGERMRARQKKRIQS